MIKSSLNIANEYFEQLTRTTKFSVNMYFAEIDIFPFPAMIISLSFAVATIFRINEKIKNHIAILLELFVDFYSQC